MSSLLGQLRLATLPPHAERLRAEVKVYLASVLEPAPAHIRARSWMGFDAAFSKKLGAPVSTHWVADHQSGPLILRFGTAAQVLASGSTPADLVGTA